MVVVVEVVLAVVVVVVVVQNGGWWYGECSRSELNKNKKGQWFTNDVRASHMLVKFKWQTMLLPSLLTANIADVCSLHRSTV